MKYYSSLKEKQPKGQRNRKMVSPLKPLCNIKGETAKGPAVSK
jgi:hypothetical protein